MNRTREALSVFRERREDILAIGYSVGTILTGAALVDIFIDHEPIIEAAPKGVPGVIALAATGIFHWKTRK